MVGTRVRALKPPGNMQQVDGLPPVCGESRDTGQRPRDRKRHTGCLFAGVPCAVWMIGEAIDQVGYRPSAALMLLRWM